VFLDSSPKVIARRLLSIEGELKSRPLLSDLLNLESANEVVRYEKLVDKLGNILEERRHFYERAHVVRVFLI
jgi:hypothetical protein